MRKPLTSLLFTAATALAAVPAQADVVELPEDFGIYGSIEFLNPTGTVTADQSIDVWVRITLDPFSAPLIYDSTDPLAGYSPGDLPAMGNDWTNGNYDVPFDSYDEVYKYTSSTCTNGFIDGCDGPAAQYTRVNRGDEWFNWEGGVEGGESLDILLFSLDPISGNAAPGTYTLSGVGIGLGVIGYDADGNEIEADLLDLFTSDDCFEGNCTFTRDVSAVPLPAAAWLFGSAMLGLFGVSRRKRMAS